VVGLRLRAPIALLALLLIAFSAGCGTDNRREGPPFEPRDIAGPRSMLVTNSDIQEIGPKTPYGAVLRWWQALQHRDVAGVRRSYTGSVSKKEVRREIHTFLPRSSQPIEPRVLMRPGGVTLGVTVRAATRLAESPRVVSITDFLTSFALVQTPGGWRLRPAAYQRYLDGKRRLRLRTAS
jgi:hypothetical protein